MKNKNSANKLLLLIAMLTLVVVLLDVAILNVAKQERIVYEIVDYPVKYYIDDIVYPETTTKDNEVIPLEEEPVINEIAVNCGSFKSFMDFRSITDTDSLQYKLQENAWTDENGLRKYNDCYCIAVSNTFGELGDIILVTLEGGETFYGCIADIKAFKDLESNGSVCIHDGSVLEFIVDTNTLNSSAKSLGDCSCLGFEGNVSTISYFGSVL